MSIFLKLLHVLEKLKTCVCVHTYLIILKNNQVWLAICEISELFEHITYAQT